MPADAKSGQIILNYFHRWRSGVSTERRKLDGSFFRWRLSAESRYAILADCF